MAILNVNPTRMELTRLKASNRTARRGHKLLKDKRDEMVKQFLELARRDRELRKQVEDELSHIYDGFTIATAFMSRQSIEEALLCPKQSVKLSTSVKNVMSVNVPKFDFEIMGNSGDAYPYGFAFTSSELDSAVLGMSKILPLLIELAQTEKTVMLLTEEIEKTRRRVNALEHVMIPDQDETIRYIIAKLDENERGNISRLMKVKEMMM